MFEEKLRLIPLNERLPWLEMAEEKDEPPTEQPEEEKEPVVLLFPLECRQCHQ